VVTRIVAMADTHGYHQNLLVPDGDILVHAGDLTQTGTLDELEQVNDFLASLPHRHKVVIAGNHDWCFARQPVKARRILDAAVYLEDEAVVLDGIRFWGSPWQPWFLDWAFNLRRGAALAEKWALIPANTDVLVTHGPPQGFGDTVSRGERVGCEDLLARLRQVQPKLHLFGHIHEDRGSWKLGATLVVNVTTAEGTLPATVIAYPP